MTPKATSERTARPSGRIAWLALLPLAVALKWAAYGAMVGRNRNRERPEEGRFTRADVRRILEHGWHNFRLLAPDIPREATVGNRMNMMLACVTLAMFQALLSEGVDRAYGTELLADAAWRIYRLWGLVPRAIARLRSRDPVERMRLQVNLFLRFPFNPPGYQLTRLPADDGSAFDMHRCPVAEYFREHQAADVCVGTWCNLDYGLAEGWGGRLERTGTLAAGDSACRFRFKAMR
jgi:ubiquinone biosynthesis protein